MGDYSGMTMTFGGRINGTKLRELCEEYGRGAEFGDAENLWEENPQKDGSLFLVIQESDVRGGADEDFEAALVEAGILFDRQSDAYVGSYPSSAAFFRPGITDRFTSWAGVKGIYEAEAIDETSDVSVSVTQVRNRLRADGQEGLANWLADKYPEIPELPPVTWTDEEDESIEARKTFEECSG